MTTASFSSVVQQGVDYLLAIGVPADAEVVLLGQEVVAATQWLEERGLLRPFNLSRQVDATPSIAHALGILRVLWCVTCGECFAKATRNNDRNGCQVIKNLNAVSMQYRGYLELALED